MINSSATLRPDCIHPTSRMTTASSPLVRWPLFPLSASAHTSRNCARETPRVVKMVVAESTSSVVAFPWLTISSMRLTSCTSSSEAENVRGDIVGGVENEALDFHDEITACYLVPVLAYHCSACPLPDTNFQISPLVRLTLFTVAVKPGERVSSVKRPASAESPSCADHCQEPSGIAS